ncbi:MAG: phosphate ABC transporter substrate-binding protein PstS [Thermomicrobiales bacterium]|nr:phosphate ABC transporter substrate-binding protein PstS [Thermomicrobiales bacterium]
MIGSSHVSSQRWKRLLLTVVAMMTLTMVVAACGGDDDDSTATASNSTAATATIAPGVEPTATEAEATTEPTEAAASTEAPTEAAATTAPATATTAANDATPAAGWEPRNVSAGLTGSGASFPDPIYQAWIEQYKSVASDTTINYQSVGSGQGKKDFAGNVTDFGGTDAYMTDEEMAASPDALHIPTVLGAVTVVYNLDVEQELQFSGETLAAIFLGTVTTWNDPLIAADNPGATLPDTPITVVHRSDGSGTTSIFTDYLSKVSTEWADQVGTGTAVEWPVGIGGEKNPGVTAGVQQTPGAIGYVELIYALANDLPAPAIKNAQGNYIAPSIESTSAAAAGALADMPEDLRVSITDPQDGANAYPIAGFTWILIHSEMTDQAKAEALTDFLYWALTTGEAQAAELHYAPLPEEVRELAIAKLTQVTVNGTAVFEAP